MELWKYRKNIWFFYGCDSLEKLPNISNFNLKFEYHRRDIISTISFLPLLYNPSLFDNNYIDDNLLNNTLKERNIDNLKIEKNKKYSNIYNEFSNNYKNKKINYLKDNISFSIDNIKNIEIDFKFKINENLIILVH